MTYHDLDAQAIARALGGEVRRGCVLAPGPRHSPADRSLAVKIDPGAPEGFVVHSFANDDPIVCRDHVRQKCGLPEFRSNGDGRRRATRSELDEQFKAAARLQTEERQSRGARPVATFIYINEKGAPLYEVLKFADPKTFRQRQPDGNGGWIWNLDDVRRVPYRLPDLLKYPSATVFICEGEKDADRVASLGLCATTAASGKWTDDIVEHFAGRDIVILQDNDEPGRKKAIAAANALHGVAWTIRIVLLPDLPDKGDVSDWLDADASRAGTFTDVCMDAPLWEPPADGTEPEPDDKQQSDAPTPDGDDLVVIDAGLDDWSNISPRGWLLANVFCREFVSSLLGDGGVGKTALRYSQYLSLATGRPLTGEHVFLRCRVLLLSFEDGIKELRRRIKAACLHHGVSQQELKGWLYFAAVSKRHGKLMLLDQKGRQIAGPLGEKIEAMIIRHSVDLVGIDPFVKAHSVGENDNAAIDDVVQILSDIATKYDVAIDTSHHVSKGPPDPGNADRGRGASAMKDATRLVYTLSAMSRDDANIFGVEEAERVRLIRVDSGKVNIVPRATDATWFKLVNVAIGNATDLYPNGDNVQTVERWTPPDIWHDLPIPTINGILDDIDRGISGGSRYSAHKNAGARAVWKVVTKHVPQKTEAQAKLVVSAWLKSGLLVEEEYHDEKARKDFLGLKIDNAKRPSGASI